MKRAILIILVASAVLWIGYAGYELFFDDNSKTSPSTVFCEKDGGILLINRIEETKNANYLEVLKENELSPSIHNLDTLFFLHPYLRLYASSQRNIIILDNEGSWNKNEQKFVKKFFNQANVNYVVQGNYFKISKAIENCSADKPLTFFSDADKKASANYWEFSENKWKRTDIYNLDKGFFEYRSSAPNTTYGAAVHDVDNYASVLPAQLENYTFHERFYAVAKDSIFRSGPMNSWIDLGYVTFNYRGTKVICSDYRSKQQPSLILIEKSSSDDSVNVEGDIHSFENFQLCEDFPAEKNNRFYVMELSDKVFFSESKSVLQQIMIDYQLGKTIALKPSRKDELFGGLPTYSNYRSVGNEVKMSKTWKSDLLFEVNTKPPQAQLKSEERTTWSYSPDFKIVKTVPIPDHLRKGTSALLYGTKGEYELIGPNGNKIWSGHLNDPIIGEVEIVDVFDNDKHQFLFRTKMKIHLLDLNGNEVGGFPYKGDTEFTSGISSFVWNGTKRFLIGTSKGEVIMLNSSGRELNIVQLSALPIVKKSFALNVKGNLRNWAIDKEGNQFLGYLETPAKAEKQGKTSANWFVKHNGTVRGYFEKEGEVFTQTIEDEEGKLIESGRILKADDQAVYIQRPDDLIVLNHAQGIELTLDPAFNEFGSMYAIDFNEKEALLIMDYLKNKIYLYDSLGEIYEGFPKEGRNSAVVRPNSMSDKISIFTTIENAVICYKVKL